MKYKSLSYLGYHIYRPYKEDDFFALTDTQSEKSIIGLMWLLIWRKGISFYNHSMCTVKSAPIQRHMKWFPLKKTEWCGLTSRHAMMPRVSGTAADVVMTLTEYVEHW